VERRRGAHIPFPGHWIHGWLYHWVCDAWLVRRQTYGYLPSHGASPPNCRYQFILLGERRHMCVNNLLRVVRWIGAAGTRTCDLLDLLYLLNENHYLSYYLSICLQHVAGSRSDYVLLNRFFIKIEMDSLRKATTFTHWFLKNIILTSESKTNPRLLYFVIC